MYRSRQPHDLNPNRAHLHRVLSSSCPGPLLGNCVQKKDRRPYSEDVLDVSPFVAAFFSWRHSLPSSAFEYPFQPFENQNNGRQRISVVFVPFGTSISICSFCVYLSDKNYRAGESKNEEFKFCFLQNMEETNKRFSSKEKAKIISCGIILGLLLIFFLVSAILQLFGVHIIWRVRFNH